jgi:iron complex outermembrane receptor protein
LFKAKAFKQTSDNSRLNLVLSGQYNRRREFDIVRSSRTAPQLELNLFTGLADLIWDHFGGKKIKGTMGVTGLYQNNSYNYRYFIPNFQLYNVGAFIAEKYQTGKWQLEGGLRYDYRSMYNITDNDKPPFDELTGNAVAPGVPYGTRNFGGLSGNLGTAYKWNKHLTINMTLASAWRAPQANEIFSDGLHHGAARIEKGKLDLDPERANSIMAGIQYNSEHLNVDVSAYVKKIDGFIYLKPTYPPQLTIRGAFPSFEFDQTNARLSGLDVNISYLFGHHIRWNGKASLLRAYDRIADDWLIQMPADRMENSLEYLFTDGKKWKQSYVRFGIQNVARQSRVPASGNIEISKPDGSVSMESDYAPPPPGYMLASLEAGTDLYFKGTPVSIILGTTNLFNTRYRDYMNAFRYYSDDMGRNVSLRIKVPFEF